MDSCSPIGIFDSGIGGLTVVRAIMEKLPNENLIYVGDTMHMPYGDKSAEAIRQYSLNICRFLERKGCKIIVMACNSASASAFDFIAKQINLPVINVIDPAVLHISTLKSVGKIGVIGTKRTIGSHIYPRKIKRLLPEVLVSSLATPLLAPMIEEGFFNNNISRTIVHSYLSKPGIRQVDTLILACTHYPLIKKDIELFFTHPVMIIDTADITASEVKQKLSSMNQFCKGKKTPLHHFYVTDFTAAFEKSTQIFLSKKVHLQLANIHDKG